MRCLQPCRLPCGAGGAIWRPCFSSDSCQSPTTLQAKFRKQGVTFHSRRQLARAGPRGQTQIPSSCSLHISLILQPPPFFPFTPLNHDFLCNITLFSNLPPLLPHTILIYKTTVSFCLLISISYTNSTLLCFKPS